SGFVKKNIIANPNCSTAQLVVALKPLHDQAVIKRVVVSTYQSVSGAGKDAMDELFSQTKAVYTHSELIKKKFPTRRDFKVLHEHEPGCYVTPYEAAGEDSTYISRIRADPTVDNGLVLWCVSDNLRKGAALNAIQIAECLINRKLISAKKKAA